MYKEFSILCYNEFKNNLCTSFYSNKWFRLPNQTNKIKPFSHNIVNGKMKDFIITNLKSAKIKFEAPKDIIINTEKDNTIFIDTEEDNNYYFIDTEEDNNNNYYFIDTEKDNNNSFTDTKEDNNNSFTDTKEDNIKQTTGEISFEQKKKNYQMT